MRCLEPVIAIVIAFGASALMGCDNGPERPRRSGHEAVADNPDANVFGFDGGLWEIPRDPDPTVALAPPVEIGASMCPGTRVLRVDRRRAPAPANGPGLTPRFYGRDEYGRYEPFASVLVCELRIMAWLTKPRPEGMNLILWRGPAIFEPDGDCDWREPAVSTRMPDGARRLTLHEHCRRRVGPGPADRTVTVELLADYSALVER